MAHCQKTGNPNATMTTCGSSFGVDPIDSEPHLNSQVADIVVKGSDNMMVLDAQEDGRLSENPLSVDFVAADSYSLHESVQQKQRRGHAACQVVANKFIQRGDEVFIDYLEGLGDGESSCAVSCTMAQCTLAPSRKQMVLRQQYGIE